MQLIRADQTKRWAQASAYFIRIQAMTKGFKIPVQYEIDSQDTPETEYVVAFDDILPIGTCRLHVVDETTAKIERVAVLEEYRGKGIGKEVIQEAEKWLTEKGIRRIIIMSRTEAVGFYEKLGYASDYTKTESRGKISTVYTEKVLEP